MSNKAWRIVALLFIVVPIIICIIISFIITYFPTSDVSLILASDFLPIAIKIQGKRSLDMTCRGRFLVSLLVALSVADS